MIKLKIKYKGKTHTADLPSTWEELTVKHFIGLESGMGDLELVSLLSGLQLTFLENTPTDFTPVIVRIAELFGNKPPEFEELTRNPVMIHGTLVDFPTSIEFTRYGQKALVRALINKEEDMIKCIPEVFAIYCQPYLYDGRFDSSTIAEVKAQIEELPIVQVYPWAVFFLRKLNELKNHLSAL